MAIEKKSLLNNSKLTAKKNSTAVKSKSAAKLVAAEGVQTHDGGVTVIGGRLCFRGGEFVQPPQAGHISLIESRDDFPSGG